MFPYLRTSEEFISDCEIVGYQIQEEKDTAGTITGYKIVTASIDSENFICDCKIKGYQVEKEEDAAGKTRYKIVTTSKDKKKFISACKEIGYQIEEEKDAAGNITGYIVIGRYCSCSAMKSRSQSDDQYYTTPIKFKKCKENSGCKEVSRLVGWLIQRVGHANWGDDKGANGVGNVGFGEIVTWCQSVGWFMKRVIEQVEKKVVIGLEYYLENSFDIDDSRTRIDMIIAGHYDNNGKDAMRIVVVELKGFYEEDKYNTVDCASKQLEEYCHNLESINEDNKKEKIDIKACLYCHNLNQGSYSTDPSIDPNVNEIDIKKFFSGDDEINRFANTLNGYFNKNGYPKDVLKEVKSRYKILNSSDYAKILCSKDEYKEYEKFLRPDQRFVYSELKSHIVLQKLARMKPADRKIILGEVVDWFKDPKKNIKKSEFPQPKENELCRLGRELILTSGLKGNGLKKVFKKVLDASNPDVKMDTYEKKYYQEFNDYVGGKNPIDIIHGGPGSGKTLIMILLMGYCTYLEENHKWIYSRTAPRFNVYKEVFKKLKNFISQNCESFKEDYDGTAEQFEKIYDKYKKYKRFKDDKLVLSIYSNLPKHVEQIKTNEFNNTVILYDEAHSCEISDYNDFMNDIVANGSLVQLFYDKNQKIENVENGVDYIEKLISDVNISVKKYELSSQFRCGRDEGYVTWVEEKLNMKEASSEVPPMIYGNIITEDNKIKIEDLDFQPKVLYYKVEKDLERLINDNSKRQQYKTVAKESIRMKNGSRIKSLKEVHGVEDDIVFVVIKDNHLTPEIIKNEKKNADYELIKNQFRILMTRGLKECYILCENENLCSYLNDEISLEDYCR